MSEEYIGWLDDEWNTVLDQGQPIVRCRDCKHATISSLGYVKYCEMFVLPDTDGYGADPQVCLPLDFFCAYGKPKTDAHAERLRGEGEADEA